MKAELYVDNSVRNMELKFEIGHLFRSLHGVINERTFELYMHHARQDSTKYSLLVTLGEENVRHGQCSNNAKTEAQNLSDSFIPGLDSIPEVLNVVNSSNGAETKFFLKCLAAEMLMRCQATCQV